MDELPKKIDPCPIAEALVEIRFHPTVPGEAVFGVLYSQFKDRFREFSELPVRQMPQVIRDQDPKLAYNAHFSSRDENFALMIGPKVLLISNVSEYVGWDNFFNEFNSIYSDFEKSGIIKNIERLGFRYINVFEGLNIFENSNLKIQLNSEFLTRKTTLTSEIPLENGICRVNVASDAQVNVGGDITQPVSGSVIDLDVIVDPNKFPSMSDAISYAHFEEKKLFFSMLDKEYVSNLNPEY